MLNFKFLEKKFFHLLLLLLISFTLIFVGFKVAVNLQTKKLESFVNQINKIGYDTATKQAEQIYKKSYFNSHKALYLVMLFNRYTNQQDWDSALNTLDKLINLKTDNKAIQDIAKLHKASIMLNNTEKFSLNTINDTLDLKINSPFYYQAQTIKIQGLIAFGHTKEAQDLIDVFLNEKEKLPQSFTNFLHNVDYALNYNKN